MMLNAIFDIDHSPISGKVSEATVDIAKSMEMICSEGDCDYFLESVSERIGRLLENPELSASALLTDMPPCKFKLGKVNILGEYWSEDFQIKYYPQDPELLKITEIHERFHAIHNLTPDARNKVWVNFVKTDPFFLELLAQLFTWIYIRDFHTSLKDTFRRLNETQPFIYKTYRIFKQFNQAQAEELYWIIRNREMNHPFIKALNHLFKMTNPKTIEKAVFNGIRKTINRFREQPFLYFTESDLHASLSNDIMDGNSDSLVMGKTLAERKTIKTPVSLVHHEYPTNFRYEKKKLKVGYTLEELEQTTIEGTHGDRGNYDLAVLNPVFVKSVFESYKTNDLNAILGQIINKDIKNAIGRDQTEELLFAIEVKFIHLFNARNIQMLHEVQGDNEKLQLSIHHKHCTRAINLVFCSSGEKKRRDSIEPVIATIRDYIAKYTQPGIINVFIESYIDAADNKNTTKPIISANPAGWSEFTDLLD